LELNILGKNPVSGFGAGVKKPGFSPRLKVRTKYLGKNPVSGFGAGVKKPGFSARLKV